MIGTRPGVLLPVSYFILMLILQGGDQHPHFTYEETKVQKV